MVVLYIAHQILSAPGVRVKGFLMILRWIEDPQK